ncbi:unnamed protein product [Caenorhabditis bovis]|uniref:Uncharacterized protein n=1 Tax=Caenorhabditis bovis TaxID=2654633 RepID=A0A8S1ERD7_9PELO|nr:unnamed protein product [Caenorhabditis bovis]
MDANGNIIQELLCPPQSSFSNGSTAPSTSTGEPWWEVQNQIPPLQLECQAFEQCNAPNLRPPISPLSFAFETQNPFAMVCGSEVTVATSNPHRSPEKSISMGNIKQEKNSEESLRLNDLEVVDCDANENRCRENQAQAADFEPKAYQSWEAFGQSVEEKIQEEKSKKAQSLVTIKKNKIYLVRTIGETSKGYYVNPANSGKRKNEEGSSKNGVSSQSSHEEKAYNKRLRNDEGCDSNTNPSDSDDAPIDVVTPDAPSERPPAPPDLAPQIPQNSRYFLPKTRNVCSPRANDQDDQDEIIDVCVDDVIPKKKSLFQHNPHQLLTTKVTSSSIPIMPMTKTIMESKKEAIEKSHAKMYARKSANSPGTNISRGVMCAPKDVCRPAYKERSPIVFTSAAKTPRKSKPACQSCGGFSAYNVDMDDFRFVADLSTIPVRAHLCEQTRVMVARMAHWNREFAKKMGDSAKDTLWHKPDEVTAQQTGFCSATVRRCLDMANISTLPKCADRIGISKNELTQLKSIFTDDQKFCGEQMRTPHLLSAYCPKPTGKRFSIDGRDLSEKRVDGSKTVPRPIPGTRFGVRKVIVNAPEGGPKKTILRWPSSNPPIIAKSDKTSQLPVVTPLLKTEKERATTKKATAEKRARGRPRKIKKDVAEEQQPTEEPVEEKNENRAKAKAVRKKITEVERVVKQVLGEMVDIISSS